MARAMGKIVKFDPKRRKPSKWTSPAAYGAAPDTAPAPRRRLRDWQVPLAWLAIIAACTAWVLWRGGVPI